MRWAMLRKSIVGRLGEEAQQAESNSIKLAEVVTAMRKAHLKEACADGFAMRRTKRGAEAEAAEAAESAGKLRRCKEDGAAAAEVRHTGPLMSSRRPGLSWGNCLRRHVVRCWRQRRERCSHILLRYPLLWHRLRVL